MSNLKVLTNKILISMPKRKNSKILSEIGSYFKNNESSRAASRLLDTLKWLNWTEKKVFDRVSAYNSKYKLLDILFSLIIAPCLLAKTSKNMVHAGMAGPLACKKDVFYDFMADGRTDWRRILLRLFLSLWSCVRARSDHKGKPVCLIVDDTDFLKTGKRIEMIGRVYSHLQHKTLLGFKCLALAITDSVSQFMLDFAIVGEKGKNGSYSMTEKELERRRVTSREEDERVHERIAEYGTSKIELAISMIRHAMRNGVRFDYLLTDSWFVCKELVHFIHSRHVRCHFIGPTKIGVRTKFATACGDETAKQILDRLLKNKAAQHRALKCRYFSIDVKFDGIPCRLFFFRRNKDKKWNALLSTDTELDFVSTFRVYANRWSIEVLFKDCKTSLGLGKCQSVNFTSQIAHTTIVAMQYNILSFVKRFESYETIGGLFREASKAGLLVPIYERLWILLMEVASAFAETYGFTDDEIMEAFINGSKKLKMPMVTFKSKVA